MFNHPGSNVLKILPTNESYELKLTKIYSATTNKIGGIENGKF